MRRTRNPVGQSSDIAFLLIIFFLLLSGLTGNRSVALSVEHTMHISERTPLLLMLQEDGSILSEGTMVSSGELPAMFKSHAELHVAIDEACAWQHVVHILSLADAYGMPVSMRMIP